MPTFITIIAKMPSEEAAQEPPRRCAHFVQEKDNVQ